MTSLPAKLSLTVHNQPVAPTINAFLCSNDGIQKVWDKRLGGTDNDYNLTSQVATSDGGYLLGGTSRSGQSGDKSQSSQGYDDYWIIKIDANGNKLWDKRFGGNDADVLNGIVKTSDGGYLLAGYSYSGQSGDKSQPSQGNNDYWVVKIDANGNKLWDKRFGGTDDDYLFSTIATSDGGYLLGGTSSSGQNGDKSQSSQGNIDYWVIKIDANGNKVWDKRFGGTDYDYLFSLTAGLDGGYLLGGRSSSGQNGDKSQPSQGSYDYWVVKIDANGNKVWDKRFGGTDYDYLFSTITTSDGGYLLGGTSASNQNGDKSQPSQGYDDYWVVKVDANGNKLWDKRFGGNGYENLSSLIATPDGGYLLAGSSSSYQNGDKSQPSQGTYDYWVIKIDANGNKVWDKRFGGNDNDALNSLIGTSDGGYLLGGTSQSGQNGDKSQPSQGSNDYWIVKVTECTVLNDAICLGTSVTLQAAGCSGAVAWSSGATGSYLNITPTQSTTYTASCTVNGCISPISNLLSITVNLPTAITQQPPMSSTLTAGKAVIVNVAATGSNLTYQWYLNSPTTNQPLPSQTSATLSLGNVQVDQSQSYYCLITGSCGSVWSTAFSLTVRPLVTTNMYTLKVGTWDDPSIWSENRVPVHTDVLQIKHAVSIPTGYVANAQKINYDPGQTLSIGMSSQLVLDL
ncbi:hypothetical protein GCM10028810_68560 [Spirosoma litoris]